MISLLQYILRFAWDRSASAPYMDKTMKGGKRFQEIEDESYVAESGSS
jgi:hypothetical protein